jgi:Prokaryotic E2 family E
MTPRALLTEFGFDPAQFSLYRRESSEPLSPDVPIDLGRGEHFEAQKDGKYGGVVSPVLIRGFQTIATDAEDLCGEGADITVRASNGQTYIEARGLSIPSPPWSTETANILIAVPGTYPQGALDAFYLEAGPTQNGVVPRQQSTIVLVDRTWILISWHYATNRPWNPSADDLGTHIEHCRGFFLSRGVAQ